MRKILGIATVALVGSMVPAFAGITSLNPGSNNSGSNNSGSNNSGSSNSGGSNSNTATITRTFLFPAVGLGQTEFARIAVVNIAKATAKGTAAACTGSISFTNDQGSPVGAVTSFKNLATGHIAHGDVAGLTPSNPSSVRNEYQGSVEVTMTAGSSAPCSLLLTLEVYDMTGPTRAVITSVIEEPLEVEPISAGRH